MLENIGFYTLSDERAKKSSVFSPLMRCELIITDKCNFNCPYCKGVKDECSGELTKQEGFDILSQWCFSDLQNVRFSGGEPTLNENLISFVRMARENDVKRIAVSTNGSADFNLYKELIYSGVNDFSISLDACCASVGNVMSGTHGYWDKVVSNIREISKLVYTTVGVVITKSNLKDIEEIVSFASGLGVHDIRIIPESNFIFKRKINIPDEILNKHKILKYRINNLMRGRTFRGIMSNDYNRCPLVLDDMVVSKNYHYPCIIYLREQGEKIGEMGDISKVRCDRLRWFLNTNVKEDEICRKNCLDVCIDYNNKWIEFKLNDDLLTKK